MLEVMSFRLMGISQSADSVGGKTISPTYTKLGVYFGFDEVLHGYFYHG
jgi:hypothetical protein